MFKLGQLITGTPSANSEYMHTTSDAIMEVIEHRSSKEIRVKIVAHKTRSHKINYEYNVNPRYFTPYCIFKEL